MNVRPLTAREVAERCGVELKTVHNWAEKNLIPHFRTPGRHLRFRATDVDAFLEKQGDAATRPAGGVVVLGGRGGQRVDAQWTYVADPLEGLLQVGALRPRAVVLVAASLNGVKNDAIVRALARFLPEARLLWVGKTPPRGLRDVERAASVAQAKALLSR